MTDPQQELTWSKFNKKEEWAVWEKGDKIWQNDYKLRIKAHSLK